MFEPVLYFVRHGRTDLNIRNAFRGKANPPLAPSGERDAEILADYFKGKPISFIICSDKKRALQTAEIIHKTVPANIHPSPSLAALNVGDFSGKPRNEANMEKLRQYIESPDRTIPGGESLNHFRSRISPVLDEAFNQALKEGVPGIVVSHSSIIHEVGNLLLSNHEALLVHPGGIVALGVQDGKTVGKILFKPMADKKNAEVIS